MKKNTLATAVLLALTSTANAGLMSISGGSDMAVVASNDLLSGQYNIGGNLFLDQVADLSFTYLGHEAGYSNNFIAGGQSLHNKNNSVGDSFTIEDAGAGLIDFTFYSESINAGIWNGGNQPYNSFQSFAILTDYTFNGVLYDAIVAFDDSGAGPDDNHDDHIIGIKAIVQSVPEPGSLSLIALGLIGLGLRQRKVK